MKARTALAALASVAAFVSVAVLAVQAARREDPNALLNPGEDCVACHRAGGKAPRSLFTVSGTVFRSGAGEPRETGAAGVAVVLDDAAGRRVELLSNAAGNFWSREEVLFPVQVSLRGPPGGPVRQGPPDRCHHGNCNQCHAYERPGVGARGRLVRP
jgi:mono/diheme cytochrome c family protein